MENFDREQNNFEFYYSINWWEKKRLIYSIFTLTGGLLVVFLRSMVPNGISSYSDYMIILFWLLGANIFYTAGWAFEILLNYYINFPFWNNKIRYVFFILGTFLSFIWMFILTRSLI